MTFHLKCAPTPGTIRDWPWEFCLGQEVYLHNWVGEAPFKVVGGELWMNWPHLHLLAPDGTTWRIPQIHVLTRPRTLRER